MQPPKPELSLIQNAGSVGQAGREADEERSLQPVNEHRSQARNAAWASETHFELPECVAWMAQDADGTWWGYEATPNQQHNGWYENEVGRYVRVHKGQPNDNWPNSLYKVK